ncbi:11245_t:CDS:2, partial [Funneliformis caledonium]
TIFGVDISHFGIGQPSIEPYITILRKNIDIVLPKRMILLRWCKVK